MRIHGFNKLTLLDYPGMLAATIFTGSCNFRCPFCHNASLVLNPDSQPCISESAVLSELAGRRGRLEGVCITGGEPTLQKDLPDFIRKIKDLPLLVKLDTNGYEPDVLSELLKEGLLDYVAMDIKGGKDTYPQISGFPHIDMNKIEKSIRLITKSGIPYEFRTTVVSEYHSIDSFDSIGKWITDISGKKIKNYYLQNFRDSGDLIVSSSNASFESLHPLSHKELEKCKQLLIPYCDTVEIRGE